MVTHGTDILEEVAYLADLWYGGEVPIVFTGAQRHAASPHGDGPRSIHDSTRVAASPIHPLRLGRRVDLVRLTAGDDGTLIKAAATGAQAVVVEAFGAGTAPAAVLDAVACVTERGLLGLIRLALRARRALASRRTWRLQRSG